MELLQGIAMAFALAVMFFSVNILARLAHAKLFKKVPLPPPPCPGHDPKDLEIGRIAMAGVGAVGSGASPVVVLPIETLSDNGMCGCVLMVVNEGVFNSVFLPQLNERFGPSRRLDGS